MAAMWRRRQRVPGELARCCCYALHATATSKDDAAKKREKQKQQEAEAEAEAEGLRGEQAAVRMRETEEAQHNNSTKNK